MKLFHRQALICIEREFAAVFHLQFSILGKAEGCNPQSKTQSYSHFLQLSELYKN